MCGVGDQASNGPHFDRREVDRGQDVPVGFDEGLPRCLSFAIRCWFDTVLLEDIADRLVGDVVAQVGQGALDAIVAPRRIFPCDARYQVHDLLLHTWSTDGFAALAVVPLLGWTQQ